VRPEAAKDAKDRGSCEVRAEASKSARKLAERNRKNVYNRNNITEGKGDVKCRKSRKRGSDVLASHQRILIEKGN